MRVHTCSDTLQRLAAVTADMVSTVCKQNLTNAPCMPDHDEPCSESDAESSDDESSDDEEAKLSEESIKCMRIAHYVMTEKLSIVATNTLLQLERNLGLQVWLAACSAISQQQTLCTVHSTWIK